jgi:hypothetical protein
LRRIPQTLPLLLACTLVLSACNPFAGAERTTSVPWSSKGQWLVADLHSHTLFSDGSYSVAEVVNSAVENGCDVLAITDHSSLQERIGTASRDYFFAIDAERTRHPGLILFAGIEWNIPPHSGREHVGVLVDPLQAAQLLPEFRQRFDDSGRPQATDPADQHPDPLAAMSWLQGQLDQSGQAAMIANHPSRKRKSVGDAEGDLRQWAENSDLMVAFEGAPGHQHGSPNGSYSHTLHTIDGWDPTAAEIGGGWDRLLADGIDLWGAIANSDYHNNSIDYPPCAFSRTHIQVPNRSPQGVLDALHAGSFWADHGRILDQFGLFLLHPDLPRATSPGETVRIRDADGTRIALSVQRGPGSSGQPLQAELIGNCLNGSIQLLKQASLNADQRSTQWSFNRLQPGADGDSCFVRARVRLLQQDGPDLLAYSNPIRIRL